MADLRTLRTHFKPRGRLVALLGEQLIRDPAIAVFELVKNAFDAMPRGGTLSVRTRGENSKVIFEVEDTGAGIPEDIRQRIFEPFFTTKDAGKGSGLGLSIVHGFVEKSGGFTSIRSSEGVGTRVRLLFPKSDDDAASSRQQIIEIEMPKGDECILVVEDDDEVRKTTLALLADLGYQTLEAGDGPSALRVLQAHPEIDLLFSDVMMPGGMRGPVLAQKAGKIRPELPVLFATGFAESTIMFRGTEAGTDCVICKPYGHDELARKIRRVLDAKIVNAAKKAG